VFSLYHAENNREVLAESIFRIRSLPKTPLITSSRFVSSLLSGNLSIHYPSNTNKDNATKTGLVEAFYAGIDCRPGFVNEASATVSIYNWVIYADLMDEDCVTGPVLIATPIPGRLLNKPNQWHIYNDPISCHTSKYRPSSDGSWTRCTHFMCLSQGIYSPCTMKASYGTTSASLAVIVHKSDQLQSYLRGMGTGSIDHIKIALAGSPFRSHLESL
jgi:hypothetical protein